MRRLWLDLERVFPLRGTENDVSAESVVRVAVGYRIYTDLPDRCVHTLSVSLQNLAFTGLTLENKLFDVVVRHFSNQRVTF